MKIRSFYPRQVLRRLQGDHRRLDVGQMAAIKYGTCKGRKMGISMMVLSTAHPDDVLASISRESAQAVIAGATTRIIVTESV